ncbi:28S ribosomal protein S34, mitochondrial isoform X1 [Nilaparvata lugens]|uniref:28S ribosomal protein S34, mitochondrial isoform X1 n=1 Tax=Nilaparvata lugens TaxID=108931 RepID=UPI00193D81BC|nr:28S ribosomal protein S34, mitochondrial isoform X1 [Nilaparvata lugens]
MQNAKVKFIGRTTDFSGKTLWEILGNLKDNGVGRLVQRHMFNRYPEPSYYRIIKVDALPLPSADDDKDFKRRHYYYYDKSLRKCRVWVEKVFRGRHYPDLIEIEAVSYKPDYRLIPRSEEAKLKAAVAATPPRQSIAPAAVPFPPLLRTLILDEMKQKGIELKSEPLLSLTEVLKQGRENIAKIEGDLSQSDDSSAKNLSS